MRQQALRVGGLLARAAMACVFASALALAPHSAAAVPDWRLVLTVRPPAHFSTSDPVVMTSVSAPAADDVWAAGGVMPVASADGLPVIEHWNGRTWRQLRPAAPIISAWNQFEIAASGRADVWLFNGALSLDPGIRPEWAHWNGTAWTSGALPVPRVCPSESVQIASAAAPGPGDVWAGGSIYGCDNTKSGLPGIPFLLNRHGQTWRFYQFAAANDDLPGITAISALGPDNIWALASPPVALFGVGSVTTENLLLHWNGRSWQRMLLGPGHPPQGVFYDMVATSAHSVWLVGAVHHPGPHGSPWSPGAVYWNGGRWATAPVAAPYSLTSAALDGQGGLWAVSQPSDSPAAGLAPAAGLWHYAHGRWTAARVALGEWDTIIQLTHAPGTGSAWAVGSALRSGSGPVPPGPSIGLIFSNT